MNSVKKIGAGAFQKCTSLTDVSLPPYIQRIDNGAFNESGLTNLTVPQSAFDTLGFAGLSIFYNTPWYNAQPDGLIYLGRVLVAYKGDKSLLTRVDDIRDDTVYIATGTFANCINLSYVIIPDSVTGLGSALFIGCKSLESIIIPSNVIYVHASSLDLFTIYTDAPEKPLLWFMEGSTDTIHQNWAHMVFGCTLSDDHTYVVSFVKTENSIMTRKLIGDIGIAPPIRQGYTFGGWATTPDGDAEYDMGSVRDAPDGTTLYAVWIAE